MKAIMLAVLMVLLSVTSVSQEKVMDMNIESENGVLFVFEVELNKDYGNLALSWEKPEFIKGRDTYRICVEGRTGREYSRLYECEVYERYNRVTDYVAYSCQEKGFYEAVRFFIIAYDDGRDVGYAVTEDLDPCEFFPEKEVMFIGDEIKKEDITVFSYHTYGTTAESNNSIYVSHDSQIISITQAGKEKERKLTETQWQKILEFISKGKVVRKYVMDPEIIMLDGSGEETSISWKGMNERDERYYELSLSEEDQQALIKYITEPASSISAAAVGITAAAVAAGALLLGKRKIRK